MTTITTLIPNVTKLKVTSAVARATQNLINC